MSVTLVGTGCGSPDNMTLEVRRALAEADLIIGASRLIRGLPEEMTAERKPAIYAREIRDMICRAMAQDREEVRICVAFSGDSGFYSGTRSLLPLLEEAGIEVRVLPGISSIQVLAARLGQPWQDWRLVSAHGTDCDAVAEVMGGRPVFFLTGGKLTPTELCRQLTEAGLGDLKVVIGQRLTYEDEKVLTGRAGDFGSVAFEPLSVMLADPAPGGEDLTPGIQDGDFIRGGVPMTKETVRAAILGQVRVRPGDTVWDVGAGTGSVSVELAMKARGGRVWAVERQEEGCRLIRDNRRRFGVWNLCPVEGPAPEALADLPAPDRVFIGGSGGHLREIIDIALDKNPDVRICVSAILLETLQEAVRLMAERGQEVEILQVAVSRARTLGKGAGTRHMMTAENPIFLITGQALSETAEEEPGGSTDGFRPEEAGEATSSLTGEAMSDLTGETTSYVTGEAMSEAADEATDEAGGDRGGDHA